MNACRRLVAVLLAVAALAGCTVPAPKPAPVAPPKIALALGGGAARGFAHIGVIKALEAQGIVPDIVVGTSAGSVVGSLYAAGLTGFELQKVALQMDEAQVSDWSLPDRGVLKGEALQNFINRAVANRPLEKLNRTFAVVATDLQSGEPVVFRTGNTGMAVRASSCVPGVFQPVSINGRDYVDGGLVSGPRAHREVPGGGPDHRGRHLRQAAERQDAEHRRRPAADLRHHGPVDQPL